MKRTLHGTYFAVRPFHLDAYLEESVFRFTELDSLAADYQMTKEGLCEALLLHAIEDDQIEVAVQKAKDLADQRVRARRKAQSDNAQPENEDASVVRLQRRGK